MSLADFGMPDEFPGTPDEKERNYNSHDWTRFQGQIICWVCECKQWHVAAEWPCGEQPSRHPVGTSGLVVDLGGLPFEEGDDD